MKPLFDDEEEVLMGDPNYYYPLYCLALLRCSNDVWNNLKDYGNDDCSEKKEIKAETNKSDKTTQKRKETKMPALNPVAEPYFPPGFNKQTEKKDTQTHKVSKQTKQT